MKGWLLVLVLGCFAVAAMANPARAVLPDADIDIAPYQVAPSLAPSPSPEYAITAVPPAQQKIPVELATSGNYDLNSKRRGYAVDLSVGNYEVAASGLTTEARDVQLAYNRRLRDGRAKVDVAYAVDYLPGTTDQHAGWQLSPGLSVAGNLPARKGRYSLFGSVSMPLSGDPGVAYFLEGKVNFPAGKTRAGAIRVGVDAALLYQSGGQVAAGPRVVVPLSDNAVLVGSYSLTTSSQKVSIGLKLSR